MRKTGQWRDQRFDDGKFRFYSQLDEETLEGIRGKKYKIWHILKDVYNNLLGDYFSLAYGIKVKHQWLNYMKFCFSIMK